MATAMKHRGALVASALLLAGLLGCGSAAVPRELADARRAYGEAQASPAATLEPAKLLEAKQALDRAERAFNEDPESQETRDLAYIAQRRAQRVQALGSIAYGARQIAQAQRDYLQAQTDLQGRERQRLSQELSQTRQELEAGQQKLQAGQEQLAAERSARVQAEQRAKEAMNKLAEVASVKNEPSRGMVITLSGSVLFASGQSNLLPIAQQKLDQVAMALKESSDQNIVVEGYTDSRGSAALNQELSQRRAQAVRDYLVAQGVPAERIRAVGRGPESPIADNTTAEGRANNRRVEIVVQPAGGATGTSTQGTGAGTGTVRAKETAGDKSASPYD